jgi:hypothetical protein
MQNLGFESIAVAGTHHFAVGYNKVLLLRWRLLTINHSLSIDWCEWLADGLIKRKKIIAQVEKSGPIPVVYRVTSAGLAPETRQHYERDINRFLTYFQIKDVEPLKEYSLQHCKQMIIDHIIHLRENEK